MQTPQQDSPIRYALLRRSSDEPNMRCLAVRRTVGDCKDVVDMLFKSKNSPRWRYEWDEDGIMDLGSYYYEIVRVEDMGYA